MKVVSLLLLALACASAWLLTARPAVHHASVQQCPAPIKPAATPLFMKAPVVIDDELDNPNIVEDESIRGQQKCGFCMG